MDLSTLVVTVSLTLGALAAADPPPAGEPCATVLEAKVCTWVVMDGSEVVGLGATIPMTLFEAVPLDAEMVWPPEGLVTIALPDEARSALGIDHMVINWEAHGHPPVSFMAQHFDFHFYSITPEEARAIDCSDESKPSSLPEGYALPDVDVPGMGKLVGLCVPRMGMHAMPSEDVTATDLFDASMILGYYAGKPVFFEPMVSRDRLLEASSFVLPMPVVEGLPTGVRYPSAFRAQYEANQRQYRFVFSGFDPR